MRRWASRTFSLGRPANCCRAYLRRGPTPDVARPLDGRRRRRIGFSGKIGVDPTITLDATLNPDFSQVESDAFQVEVNQRFPDVLRREAAVLHGRRRHLRPRRQRRRRQHLRTAVHTRRIVDPIFGAKLTGNTGSVSFGTLTAWTKRSRLTRQPDAEGNRVFNIGRASTALVPATTPAHSRPTCRLTAATTAWQERT